MALTTDACRVEVAWGTASALSTAPAWENMSGTVALELGVTWNRGRPDGQSQVSAGQLSFALRNDSGDYTPGRISSARYPNVVLGRRARVTVRPASAGAGNLLSAEDASFEAGTTGAWTTALIGYTPAASFANSATQAQAGTKSLLVTWATSTTSSVGVPVSGLVIGRTYTASAYVWVPAGSPSTKVEVGFGPIGSSASAAAFSRISVTFTATASTQYIVFSATSTGAGQQAWVDAVQVDEGSTVVAFTTAAPPITVRFDGPIDSLVVGMSSVGAVTFVGASDMLKQLGDNRPLRSILSEEILADVPVCYWPLGEPSGSTTAGDVSGAVSIPALTATQRGAGGTLTFGVGTGPAFDGATAAVLTPASTVNGLYLTASVPTTLQTPFGVTMGCFLNTSTAAAQGTMKILDPYGSYLTLEVTATGKLLGAVYDASTATIVGTVTSVSNVTGGTKHIAVTVGLVGTAATLTLWLDGANAGTATWVQSSSFLYGFTVVNVGGSAADPLLTGTVSHPYVTASALSSTRISEQRKAGLTGFIGELSGTRQARLLRLAGLPAGLVNCEAGLSTMAQQATAGQGPLTASQDVVNAERGVLFAAGDGRVTFHGRSHRYNAAAAATLDAVNDLGSTDLSSTLNDQQLLNDVSGTRPSGASQRAVNASSVSLNGTFATSLSLLVNSDGLAQQILQSMANAYSVPQPRAPEVMLDMLTVADATVTAALALDVGARADVVNLPVQAPSLTLSLFTEGLRESVTNRTWDLTISTSPATYTAAWILDSPTYSQLDSTTILAL